MNDRPKKSWRRRILKWAFVLVVVLILVRIALPFILPVVIDQVAGSFDLSAEYDDLSLSLLGGEVELRGLVVTPREGGEAIARLNYARVDLRMLKLFTGDLHVARIDVDGVDLHVVRKADGSIPLLDRFLPEPGGEVVVDEPAVPEKESPAPADYSLPLRIDDLLAIEFRLHVTDEAVSPALDTTFQLGVVLSDLGSPERISKLGVLLEVEDVLGALRINGSLEQRDGGLRARTDLAVTDLGVRALAAYLEPLGIEPQVQELDLRLKAGFELLPDPQDAERGVARLEVTGLRARSDGVTGASLGRAAVEIRGLGSNTTEIVSATLADVAASLLLDEKGDPVILGIALRAPPPREGSAPEPVPEPAVAKAPHFLRITSGSVKNVRLALRDETDAEPVEAEIVVESLEAANLTSEPGQPEGMLEARISSPGIVGAIELTGTASPFVQPLSADLVLSIRDVTPGPTRAWLDRILIALPFEHGDLRTRLVAKADLREPGVLGANVGLTDLEFQADGARYRVADRIVVSGALTYVEHGVDMDFALEGTGLDATATKHWLDGTGMEPLLVDGELGARFLMQVRYLDDGLRLAMELRDTKLSEGEVEHFRCDTVAVSGFVIDSTGMRIERISGRAPSLRVRWDQEQTRLLGVGFSAASPETAPKTEPETAREDDPVEEDEAPPAPGSDSKFSIGEIELLAGDLVLRNEGREGSGDVRFLLDLTSNGVAIEGESLQAGVGLRLEAPETGAETKIDGLVKKEGAHVHAEVGLQGARLGGERLSALLPRGVSFSVIDGVLTSKVTADLDASEKGVQKLDVTVEEVAVREADSTVPIFGFERFRLAAELHEATKERPVRLDVDEVSLTGLQADLRMSPNGDLHLLGLTFSPVPPLPAVDEPTEGLTPEQRIENFLQSREAPPRLQVRKLLVEVNRLTVIDEKPGADPLVFEEIVLTNPVPIDSETDEDTEEEAQVSLSLTAKASRFLDRLDVRTTIRPFNQPPSAEVHVLVDGILGPQIMQALPTLAESVDLSEIQNGRFEARAEARLKYRGQHRMDFNIARGFDAEITGIHFSDAGEEPLLTVDEISASISRLQPGRIDISTVEVIAPRTSVTMREKDIRVLGVLIKRPEPAPDADPATDDAGTAEATAAADDPADTPAEAPKEELVQSSGGFSIANLYVSDLSLDFRDEAVEEGQPPVHMPLIGTEIEVRGFRTNMGPGDLVRFHIVARSDKIRLPDDPDRERSAFDEISLAGQLGFVPDLQGRVRASIIGLELSNLRGVAAKKKVTLDGGSLELGLGMRFRDDGSMNLNTSISLRDLSLSEPEGGTLYKLLKLPASTDTVIFLLRDHAGTISLSFGLNLPPDGVSTTAAVSLAITKVSELIALAVLKSPLRVTAGLAGMVGLGAGEEEPEEPVVVTFQPGSTRPTREGRDVFDDLSRRMQDESDLVITIEHELGQADVPPIDVRYNPSAEDCRAIAGHLRIRQRQFIQQRADLQQKARAALASGRREEADRVRLQLRALDRNIGILSNELDQVLEIVLEGSERRRVRRVRLGCITLGRMRIEELARHLQTAGISLDRVRYRRPRYVEPTLTSGGTVTIQPGRRIDTEQPKGDDAPPIPDTPEPDAGK